MKILSIFVAFLENMNFPEIPSWSRVNNSKINLTPMDTSTSPCCSGRSLYGMQPVVFRLTPQPQSIESSILKTTTPCRSGDLKDPCCSYQISCILRSSSTHIVILRRWQKPRNIFVTETFVIVVRNYYLSKSLNCNTPQVCILAAFRCITSAWCQR